MPPSSQSPSDVVRPAARLHGDDTGRNLGAELHDGIAAHASAHHNFAGCVETDEAARRLSEIDTDDGKLHGSAPSSPGLHQHAISCRRGRGGPSIELAEAVAEEAAAHPGVAVEVFCTDEHRLGLKPVLRSVWAPKGQRPTALGHHRFQWLYVTAFVDPATGETVWYLTDTVSKPLFADLLDAFARAVGAGPKKRVVLLLDNAGWHTLTNFAVPGRPQAGLPAALQSPTAARRDALDAGGRAGREHVRPQPDTSSSTPSQSGAATSPTRQPEISSRTNFAWWPKNHTPA